LVMSTMLSRPHCSGLEQTRQPAYFGSSMPLASLSRCVLDRHAGEQHFRISRHAPSADLEPFVADAHTVIARVDLTDAHGGPQCARLKPPALTLERAD
jgi:hypothetical protein